MRSLLMFEYGKSKEGYYDTTEFIRQQFRVILMFEFLCPDNRLLETVDNSTVHRGRSPLGIDPTHDDERRLEVQDYGVFRRHRLGRLRHP